MKPCDVRDLRGLQALNETGLRFNNTYIDIDTAGVFLVIEPHCRIKINSRHFKAFAEWYLEDQVKSNG